MPNYPDGWFNSFDMQAYRLLAAQVPEGGRMVEVGAYQGRSLASIAEVIIERGLKVLAVEPFLTFMQDEAGEQQARRRLTTNLQRLGFDVPLEPDLDHVPMEPEIAASLKETLRTFGLNGQVRHVRKTSAEAADLVLNESIDLVFIDGDHSYDGLITDIYTWWPKLRPSGTMSGHDYVANGGTILMREMRTALFDAFGGSDGLDKPVKRSTVWRAMRPPRFVEHLTGG